MNKMMKRALSLLCVILMLATTAALFSGCSSNGETVSIGVGLYQDSGAAVTAIKNYLGSLEDELNVKFTFVTLSQVDEATNKTAVQTLIASGCQGLILTMDSATDAILEEAKKAGVYVAGWLNDYNASFDSIKDHPNFVGTAVDGRYLGFEWGKEIADRVIKEGYKNIGMVKFPSFAFPHQNEMDSAFREAIAAYNATAADADKITVQAVSTELMFSPLDATYLSENKDLDAIFGMCAGVEFIYPTLVAQNRTDIKLFTAGLVTSDDVLNNFGEKGNKCIQEMVYCNSESIVYPLVMLLNKISGNEFSDKPASAERVDCSQMRVTNNAELDLVVAHSLQITGKIDDAFLSAKDVKALLAANGGTYKGLVEAVQSMSVADLQKKVG